MQVNAMLRNRELPEGQGNAARMQPPTLDCAAKTLEKLMPADKATWSLYIIEASDASFYTGITTDVERRFEEHLQCRKGAKYFNGRKPICIVYREDGHSRSSASRREAEIKKLTRGEKVSLIATAD
jgi:putative endonuclease